MQSFFISFSTLLYDSVSWLNVIKRATCSFDLESSMPNLIAPKSQLLTCFHSCVAFYLPESNFLPGFAKSYAAVSLC